MSACLAIPRPRLSPLTRRHICTSMRPGAVGANDLTAPGSAINVLSRLSMRPASGGRRDGLRLTRNGRKHAGQE